MTPRIGGVSAPGLVVRKRLGPGGRSPRVRQSTALLLGAAESFSGTGEEVECAEEISGVDEEFGQVSEHDVNPICGESTAVRSRQRPRLNCYLRNRIPQRGRTEKQITFR